jgi:hypothetical protein
MVPTHDQIIVSVDALRTDADEWARAAKDMHDVAAKADTQKVDAAAFSFAGHAAAAGYETLRAKMAGLISGGAREFDAIAAALRASADAYEADEAAGAHRIQNIY